MWKPASSTKRSGLHLLLVVLQDGLGDTIRVSLTEPPEEEIDPCQRLANLGTQAANLQIGVVMHFHFVCFPFILSQLTIQKISVLNTCAFP
jgi:4-hydroxy-3-methylbut-2-en-1-yl diphosphate synthase IspG/GcpE